MSKGIALRTISDSTKIGLHYLQAIERDEIEKLPGGIFRVNYIRQYARAIDYDEQELLSRYGLLERPEPEPEEEPARGLMRLFRLFQQAKH